MLYASLGWDHKDPSDIVDYSLNWINRLEGGDAIASSTWSVAEGDGALVLGSTESSDTSTTVWLSGGTNGIRYVLLNRVMTTMGRTFEVGVSIYSLDN